MTMRSSDILRRMAGERLFTVSGQFMSNGVFLFNHNNVVKHLSFANNGGFRGVSGDVRVITSGEYAGNLDMIFAKGEDVGTQFSYFEGVFNRRYAVAKTQNSLGTAQSFAERRYYQKSDNQLASAFCVDNSAFRGEGFHAFIPVILNDQEIQFRFFPSIPAPPEGFETQIELANDTYFGSFIGLRDGIYIGQPTRDQFDDENSNVPANWWDGQNLIPLNQPNDSFFNKVTGDLGQEFDFAERSISQVNPLCRLSENTALCTGNVNAQATGNFQFPDHEGFPWFFYFMRITTTRFQGVSLTSETDTNYLEPSIFEAGIVSRLKEPVFANCIFSGNMSLVAEAGINGFQNPIRTSYSGTFIYRSFTHGGIDISVGGGGLTGSGSIRIHKLRNGPYEVWHVNDPDRPVFNSNFPDDDHPYERFFVVTQATFQNSEPGDIRKDGTVGAFAQMSFNNSGPYPQQNVPYSFGERVVAACLVDGNPFVMSQRLNIDPETREYSEIPSIGFLGNTKPSPFGDRQGYLRSAGGIIFANNNVMSLNNGETWLPSTVSGGPGSISAGNRTIPWTFGLTRKQIEDAQPV